MVTPGQASPHSPTRVLVPDGNMFPTTQVTWSEREAAGSSSAIRTRYGFDHLPPSYSRSWKVSALRLELRESHRLKFQRRLMPDVTTAGQSKVEYIIFLNRTEFDVPDLVPFSRELGLQWVSQFLAGTGANDEVQAASIRELLNARLFELRYRTLDWAVAQLEGLIRRGGGE